eukprot:4518616-Amphidinium_carterae.1
MSIFFVFYAKLARLRTALAHDNTTEHSWMMAFQGQGQDALAEGQLFIRNDLRSGQRQLARRLEAKLDKILGVQWKQPHWSNSPNDAEQNAKGFARFFQLFGILAVVY